jgi:general stress protein YciG
MADKNQRSSSERGFAAMDPAKQREIARKGGESVPAAKRSFSQDHALAAQAGRKGGQSVAAEDRSFSRNRELAAEAGRKGGQESGGGRGAKVNRPPAQQSDTNERAEEKDRADENR